MVRLAIDLLKIIAGIYLSLLLVAIFLNITGRIPATAQLSRTLTRFITPMPMGRAA